MSPSPSEDDSSVASPKQRGGRKESEQRRRVMMNQYFDELIALLSMLSERCIPKKMDKATTLHEAVQCIQVYSDLTSKPENTLTLDIGKSTKISTKAPKSPSQSQTDTSTEGSGTVQGLHTVGELLHFFLDAHDAFLLVVSDSGRVLFSTELVTSLLGHMQTRLVGQNFFDFLHENDHKLFQDLLKSDQGGCEGVKLKDRPIIAFPPKLVHCHIKLYAGETGYFPQYLQFKSVVYLRKWEKDRSAEGDMSPASPDPSLSDSSYSNDHENQSCLVMIGKLPTSLSMVDLPVGTNDVNFEFDMRVSREGRVIDIDKHAVTVLGFTTSEIIGTSFFDYIDPYHLTEISEGMSTFLSDGLGTTTPYRFLTKGGRSIWLISKGYLSYNPWNNKPDHILLTNRILGCDQVLPEHRFFRSRRLMPDLEGNESYSLNIPVSRAASPPPQPMATSTTGIATVDQAVHSDIMASQFNLTDLNVSDMLQQQTLPHHQQHQGGGHPQQMPPSFQSHVANPQSMQQHHHQQVGGGQQQQQQILQTPQSTQTAPSAQTPVTPSPLQGGIGAGGMSQGQVPPSVQTPSMAPASQPPPTQPQKVAPIQNFEDIQRELDRKNREIFEMQKKLFEQQQLFEKERSQFYSITAQVMQCISSNAMNQIPPNMQMVFSTSNEYNPPNMLTTQSKGVMDDPLHGHGQPTTSGHFSSNAGPAVTTPLWDGGGSSMGGFTNASQQFPLQQSHQQPQPSHGHQAQPQHQMGQSVSFTSSAYASRNTTSNGSASTSAVPHGLHNHPNPMLSEQFGLSQAFKMSGHQSLAEHNMQFYHHIPEQQQQPSQQQSSGQARQPQAHLPSLPGAQSPGYGALISNDVLSNLASSPSSSISMSLPSLPAGMHAPQKQQQQPSQNLADVLHSVRFS